jgi:ABC-type antimicrobial peptide transport system permease subunit
MRTPDEPMRLAAALRSAIREVDPDEAVQNVMTQEQRLARNLTPQRFMALLMSSLAALGLVIAAVGIYAVVAYAAGQRTQEIGIRMALGASRADVMRLILGGGVKVAALGIAAGVIAALALTRVLRSVLFGTSPTDPIVFAAVSAILAGVTIAATYVPARRAASTDPWRALRGRP